MNPHEILGITPGATDEEIRAAYRRQAARWHPDRNPDDPGAPEKFREARAAFEFLSRPSPSRPHMNPGFEDDGAGFAFGDLFDVLFRHHQVPVNLDVEYTLEVRYTQAALGGPMHIRLPDGREVRFDLPERVTEGQGLRVPGHGHALHGRVGDLILRVHIHTPPAWTARQRQWLEKLDESMTNRSPKPRKPRAKNTGKATPKGD